MSEPNVNVLKAPVRSRTNVRTLTSMAMLTALAYVVMLLSKMLPQVQHFLQMDLKDTIICIGGFLFGPLSAAVISIVVAVVEMFSVSDTGPIGCIMNIVATAAFCCPACWIYKKNHTMKGAVLGLLTGVVLLIAVMLAWNYFLTPIYQGQPREAIADLLLPVFLPFNAVKGGLNMTATLLLYKPVVGALRSAKLIPESTGHSTPVEGKKKTGITIVVLFLFATCVLFALSLQGII